MAQDITPGEGVFEEDTAHVSSDQGQFVLGVRNSAGATLTSADGDYSPVATDAQGRVGVQSATATASRSSNGVIFSTDYVGFSYISLQLSGTFDLLVEFEGSNDNTNWVPHPLVTAETEGPGSALSTTAEANPGIFQGVLRTRYFRAVVSGYVSGTVDTTTIVRQAGAGTGVNIIGLQQNGQVSTTSSQTEDVTHSSGAVGEFILGVRNDTGATLTSADGDYSPIATTDKGAVQQASAYKMISGTLSANGVIFSEDLLGYESIRLQIENNGASFGDILLESSNNNIDWDWNPVQGYDTVEPSATFTETDGVVFGTLRGRYLRGTVEVYVSGTVSVKGFASAGAVDNVFVRLAGSANDVRLVSEKAEDTQHTSSDTGTFVLGVRNSAGATLTSADGDYSPIAVTGTGAVQVDSTKTEDAAHSSGTQGAFVLGVRNDAAATTFTSADGDYSPLATDAQGRVGVADLGGSISVDDNAGSLTVDNTVLSVTGGGTEATAQRVTIANDSTGVLSVDDNGGSLTVDGTVSVSGTVTVDTELPAAAALADNTANPTVPGVGAFAMGFDGTNWDRIRADGGAVFIQDGGNVISVDDAAGSLTVDLNGGTDALIGRVKITDGTDIATVRDLTNSDPLDVAIVDGNGDQITSFGGGTQYTEDAASAANPVGTQPVLRRRDTPVGEVSADGDVVAQNATNYGAAYVQVVNSGGSFVDTFGGGTQYTEGDTDATITGTAILWEDTSDTLRAVSAAKPLPVSDAGGSLTVDGTVSVSGTVTVDTELPAAALLGDNTANPTITSVGAFPHVWDSAGTNWDRMPGDDLGVMVRPQGAQVNDSITALNDTAGLSFGTDAGDPSFSAVGFRVAGTWTATLTFQGSMDGFDFVTIPALPVGGGPAVTTTTANGQWWVNAGGFRVIRLQATAFTSGTANVELFGSSSGQQFVSVLGDDGTTSRILKTDASGELQVDVLSMPTVSTSSQKTEDTGHTTGDTGVFILGVRNDDASSTLTNANADYSPIAVDGRGRVFTGDNQIEDLPHSTGHAGSFILGVRNDSAATAFTNADGDYSPISVDGNGRVIVTEGGGSLTIDGTVTANQGTAGTAWEVVGDVANDVGVPANPLVSGGRASTAVPTAVSADGDAVYEWLSRQGAPVVTQVPHVGLIGSQPWDLVHEGAQYTSQQTSTVLVAGGASEKIVVTQVQIQAFGTTAFDLQVYFGTGAFVRGTNRTIFDGTFKPSTTLAPGYTSLGPFIAGTNGDDIMVTTSAAGSVTISVWYYIVT